MHIFASHSGQACQICLPFPARSLVDYLIESDHIVLARENPEKPFTLRAIKTLKGDKPPAPLDSDSETKIGKVRQLL